MSETEKSEVFRKILASLVHNMDENAEDKAVSAAVVEMVEDIFVNGKPPRETWKKAIAAVAKRHPINKEFLEAAGKVAMSNAQELETLLDKWKEGAMILDEHPVEMQAATAYCRQFVEDFYREVGTSGIPADPAHLVAYGEKHNGEFLSFIDAVAAEMSTPPGENQLETICKMILDVYRYASGGISQTVHAITNAAESDAFFYEAVTEHPENIGAVAEVMKGTLTRAARAAEFVVGTAVTLNIYSLQGKKQETAARRLKEVLATQYKPEEMLHIVIGTLSKTFAYLREHEPEQAAALEEYTRAEIKAAFLPLVEYVKNYGLEPLEKTAKRLQVIRTKKATERTDTIDKISSFLPGEVLYNLDSPQELAMEKRGSQNRVSAFVNIIPDETITAEMGRLDPKDVVTLNSVYAIYMAGNNIMTERQVFDVMTGDTGNPPTKKQLEDIRARLSKMTHLGVKLDVSAEAVALGYPKGTRLVRDVNLIPGEMGVMRNINGQETSCLAIYTKPPLLWYAERKGQILRYPVNMLDVGLSNTDDVIVLKNYLASRVRSRLQPVILYETIYKQLGELGTTPGAIRKKKVKIRDMVKKIMEQFKKQGEITQYKNVSKGKEIYSIVFVRA